ncbi:MAG: glycerol-3-phosphate acyltransferase, partial [Oscillospiraceae bacterium]|nr:glycerol-3-phosphate acyltransferase [Oscillospiraceae bacterium]
VLTAELAVLGKFYAALFCILGHMFPVTEHGKGGKGILCGGALLLLLDWRIALVGWGLFVLCVALTRYISLGSIAAAVSFPVMCIFVYDAPAIILSAVMAALVVWAHRENVKRLLKGTENKFSLRKKGDKA